MGSTTAEVSKRIQSCMDQIVAELRGAASEVRSDRVSVFEMTEVLKTAFANRNRFDAALSRAVGALDKATEQAPDGELTVGLSCPQWLTENLQISSSAGYAQVRLARQLPSLPDTSKAFERGELSSQHASVVARSVEMVVRGGGDPIEAEGRLLEEARYRDPRDLFRWGLSLAHELAPKEMEAEEDRRVERRYLHIRELFDGGFELEGYLDPERGTRLKVAIEGVLGPRRKDDLRSPAQRRADGLDEVVRRVLNSGVLPVRGGQRPHLVISASIQTLCGNPGAPAALLDWGMGFPLSGKALRRIATDAEITPILVDDRGDPLRVGRKYRTATMKMRKALAFRDRRCVWPKCGRPPEWTQADHEQPWAKGGKTDLEGMRLLCGKHHRDLHRGWRLERQPDRSWVAHPPSRAHEVWGPAVHDPPLESG